MSKKVEFEGDPIDGSWAELFLLGGENTGGVFVVRTPENILELVVYGDDVATVSPKQLRKFAEALKKLADKVDPPKEKTKYYFNEGNWLYYRRQSGKRLLDFYSNKERGWLGGSSWSSYVGPFTPISKKDLPAEARYA